MKDNLIREAYGEVDFLRRKLWNADRDVDVDLVNLPLLEKEELVGDSLKLMPPRYLPLLYQGKLLRKDTSGSTGKYLEIYWQRSDFVRSMFSLWFYRNYFYGIQTWDKLCRFYMISRAGIDEEMSRKRKNALEFSKNDLTEERLLEIYREMQKFQPVWLLLQPCIAELICQLKARYQLSDIDSVKYIEMTGEELTEELRERIQNCFKCPVANQYGANEVNSIAYECPQGNLHCMEDNVFVEILNDEGKRLPDGECGNIYVTTLHNHAMPFIRYGIGDVGFLEKNTCSCGHKGKILHLKSGRRDDWILMENGEKVNPYVFLRAVVAVNAVLENCIFQFQIIQTDYQHFRVNLAVDEEVSGIQEVFVDNIGHAELRNASYDFHYYDNLFPDITGKRKFFTVSFG
ncbi:MAG: AMP-binding protein [Clostridium sp.]|nr:AMP-binding protein [Clostridium sp.]